MKKILILLLAVLPFVSCVSKSTADKTNHERDSLMSVVAQKDSVINDVFTAMSAVSENLETIKMREKIINKSVSAGGEIPKQSITQINEDIQAINQLLQENRETISRLERSAAQLRKANVKITSLQKVIDQLNVLVESKDQEMRVLKKSLQQMHVEVAELNEQVSGLSTKVSGLSQEKAALEGEVKTQTDILSTGYYIVGSEKALLTQEIVYKSGFIGRTLKINENRSLDTFTQVDIRNFDQVVIGQKKATLVSSHPAGSYELTADANGIFKTLIIKDKGKFWEYSKVLVVSYK